VNALLSVFDGPAAGSILVIRPGMSVRVGSDPGADYVLAEDPFLSRQHFTISFDGGLCKVTDLNSRNGLFVNGSLAPAADLQPFDIVVAGSSHFVVSFDPGEGTSTSPADLPGKEKDRDATRAQAITAFLRAQAGKLYGIFDAARSAGVLHILQGLGATHVSLYDGQTAEDLRQFAPYLVQFGDPADGLGRFIGEGWGDNWGVYFTAEVPSSEVRHHLRKFLMVTLPNGKNAYFRFYDPRVMREFVTGFSSQEAAEFFGPVRQYLCEDEDPAQILRICPDANGVGKCGIPMKVRQTG
jgi:hypothetical protein